jgi:hypothetical protein
MIIKKFIAITLLGLALLSTQAVATFGPVVSKAYEVALSDFRAPTTANGGIAFRECEDCTLQTVRVTAGTRYSVNGKSLKLAAFREMIAAVRKREDALVTVLHHLETDTIESINVSY